MRQALAAILAFGACSKPADEGAAKQWQAPAPPHELTVPSDVSITVVVDGAAGSPITTATLEATKPDFSDPEHRAWLVASLVPGASPSGSTIEASSANGVSVKFLHPTSDGLEPVLYLTRRGELIVAAVDPKEPFPRYHGQGGRLHRAGDAMPHVSQVAKLAITRPATR
jgi:hypothetical protein